MLDLESERWPRPRKVRLLELAGDDAIVQSRRGAPSLEEVVQLRSPGTLGPSVMLTGVVVGLELSRRGNYGVRITIELLEPPQSVIDSLTMSLQQGSSAERAAQPVVDAASPSDPYRRSVTPPGREMQHTPAYGTLDADTSTLTLDAEDLEELIEEEEELEPQNVEDHWGDSSSREDLSRECREGRGGAEPIVNEIAEALRDSAPTIEVELPEEGLDGDEDQRPPRRQSAKLRQVGTRSERAPRGAAPLIGRAHGPAVGIDFGTSTSKIAALDCGEVVLIEDTELTISTRAMVPSVVAVEPSGELVVGEDARDLLAMHPELVIPSIKRVLGLNFSDPLTNGLLENLACPTVVGPNDSILFEMGERLLTVPEVVSEILKHLVGMATRWAGAPVKQAVMTVPVDFDRMARRQLEVAARMAGLEVLAMVPEPVAAVMGCGIEGRSNEKLRVAVYDFGGGTFDASFVEVGDETFTVLGTSGDRWLGGDDFDDVLARHVAARHFRERGVRLDNKREEFQRLLFACEEGKRLLSTLNKVEIIMAKAGHAEGGEQVLLIPIERDVFDDLAHDIVSSTRVICQQAAAQAGIVATDVDSLLITGGTTRIPVVTEAAQDIFGCAGVTGIHPEHAVVIGAAVRAAVISGEPVSEDVGRRLRGYGVSGRDIGIAMADGSTELVIRSNQQPPVAAARFFSAALEEGATYAIELVEGAHRAAADNKRIGNFIIQGLPVGPDGTVVINIYFELSSTGTLTVTAQDRASGQRVQATFELSESS